LRAASQGVSQFWEIVIRDADGAARPRGMGWRGAGSCISSIVRAARAWWRGVPWGVPCWAWRPPKSGF